MSVGIRIFWMISLCIFVSGCGKFMTTAVPGTGDPAEVAAAAGDSGVQPGDKVRVTLPDGEQVKGYFVSREGDVLTLDEICLEKSQLLGNGVVPEPGAFHREFRIAEISGFETYHNNNSGAWVVGIGLVVAVGALAGSAAAPDISFGPMFGE